MLKFKITKISIWVDTWGMFAQGCTMGTKIEWSLDDIFVMIGILKQND